jgi:hypothetical protein
MPWNLQNLQYIKRLNGKNDYYQFSLKLQLYTLFSLVKNWGK